MTVTIRQPKVTVNIVNASATVSNTGQKILFVGQKTSAGSAVPKSLVKSIANGGAEDNLFGRNSMLAIMIRANKVRNKQIRVDAISLDDKSDAAAATGKIVVVGTAIESGTITVIVGSERNHTFTVAVTSGSSNIVIADAIQSAIETDLNVPVATSSTAGTVTITAVTKGTFGNSIPLEVRGVISGITTTVTGMTSGTTDPVLAGVFGVIPNSRYQAIVWGYPNDTVELRTFLDGRFNADGTVLDGVGFTALTDTLEKLKILGAGLNSQSLVIIGTKKEVEDNYAGSSIVEIPLAIASQFAGFRGLRLDSEGFSIADLVVTANGPLDSFGSPALASKPYFNTPFAQLPPIKTGRGFDDSQIEDLKNNGVSVLGNNIANNAVINGEMVTTYKTDPAGNPDVTFTFLNFVDTASQAREYFFNNLRKRFAQSRLTEGDIIKGRDMANALVIRSFLKRLYQDLSGSKFVLLESGEDALIFFNNNLLINLDKTLGKVVIQMTVPLVTQIREIAATMKIAFSTTA